MLLVLFFYCLRKAAGSYTAVMLAHLDNSVTSPVELYIFIAYLSINSKRGFLKAVNFFQV